MEEKVTIGIIVAMDKELALFNMNDKYEKVRTSTTNGFTFESYNIGDARVVVTKSGIGKVNAAVATTLMSELFHPDYIISSGVCGFLAPMKKKVQQGDIVLSAKVHYHDVYCGADCPDSIQGLPEYFPSFFNPSISRAICDDNLPRIFLTNIISGDYFVDTYQKAKEIYQHHLDPDEKFYLSQTTRYIGEGLDMESAAIAQVCYLFKIPFGSLRIVSDTPLDTDAPSYESFWDFAGERLHYAVIAVIKYIAEHDEEIQKYIDVDENGVD